MPPTNVYNNQICKDSWHQAEVGGSPHLTLLPLIFKKPTALETTHISVSTAASNTRLQRNMSGRLFHGAGIAPETISKAN